MKQANARHYLGKRVLLEAGAFGVYTGTFHLMSGSGKRWMCEVTIDGIVSLPVGNNLLRTPGEIFQYRGCALRSCLGHRDPKCSYIQQVRDLLGQEHRRLLQTRGQCDTERRSGLFADNPIHVLNAFSLGRRERELAVLMDQVTAMTRRMPRVELQRTTV
jgi:hypothetical protein